jgi:hypothetical protein
MQMYLLNWTHPRTKPHLLAGTHSTASRPPTGPLGTTPGLTAETRFTPRSTRARLQPVQIRIHVRILVGGMAALPAHMISVRRAMRGMAALPAHLILVRRAMRVNEQRCQRIIGFVDAEIYSSGWVKVMCWCIEREVQVVYRYSA